MRTIEVCRDPASDFLPVTVNLLSLQYSNTILVDMVKQATISVKVPSELKEKMRSLGIEPAPVLRRAIREEIRKKEVESVKQEAEALKGVFRKIPRAEVVKSIREDREAG